MRIESFCCVSQNGNFIEKQSAVGDVRNEASVQVMNELMFKHDPNIGRWLMVAARRRILNEQRILELE